MRLIDADALYDKTCLFGEKATQSNPMAECVEAVPWDVIENVPTIEPNKWISVKDRLPEDGENVLVFARNIHIGKTADIAKLFRGISKEEREKMIESGDKRGQYYYPEDEWGNNLKPYYWKGLYQMDWFGQEVTHWMPLPEPPEKENP